MSAAVLEQFSAYLIPARRLEAKRGHVSTPWPTLNEILGGGWQLGALNEVHGPRSSGRTSVLYASLGSALNRGAVAALVDAESALDARRAERAGMPLRQLLWVCASQSQTLKAAELLVLAGGFELVGLDFGDSTPRMPTAAWIRLRNAAEQQGTAVLLAARFPIAGSFSALSLQLRQTSIDFGAARERVALHPPLVTAISSLVSLARGHRAPERTAPCSLVFQEPVLASDTGRGT